MSASREKKSRQESLAGGYVDPRTKREKDEQAKDRRSNALYIAIAVIFVIVGIVVTVANSKVIERSADAVTIGNETYTAADVSYFYNTIYNSFVSQNSYYLSGYGLDTSKSLKEQDCPVTDGGTWYDYFRDQALESLKSYALLAQKAKAEGFDGSEYVEQSVQETLSDLDASAASAGYTRAQYIKAVCGPLVNEKVFERNIRMMALAQAYSNSYSDSLSYTSDEVQAAYDADPKSYQSADIEYILFSSSAGSDATDEEKAQLLDEAKQKAEETGAPAGAMVLPDGRVVTGKTSSLLGASAALLLNSLKAMAGIRSDMNLISNQVIEPISALKIQSLGHHNPRLHSDEVLIALAISALTNPLADMARAQLGTLRGCDAHFSVIISEEDIKLYKRLGIHVSCEPKYESKRLYHK